MQSDVILQGNDTSDNRAIGEGGGLALLHSKANLSGERYLRNTVTGEGGGVYALGSQVVVTNSVIAENVARDDGAAIFAYGSEMQWLHTTISSNEGRGAAVAAISFGGTSSALTMTNSIITGHGIGISAAQGNRVVTQTTLWYGNTMDWTGAGAITRTNDLRGNPYLAADGYHLTPYSSAIDQGTPTSLSVDVDGDPRPYGPRPDLGADEHLAALPPLPGIGFLPFALR